ncbi:SusC/RagA family TonB-linked outer membrane protein [Chitinophaga japonensis]|uniref:SusC/RagA family TonB-linked outer membrane protein n=1 Tax=Chitinophaga japonensis TaxID=104662 RepID=UPI0011A90E20|nr:TonB-dependent receptor [Chitinophaga japonensis]
MQKIRQLLWIPVRRTALASLALVLLSSVAVALPGAAQMLQKVVRQLQVPAGSLSGALKKLEATADIRLAYDETALKKIQVPAGAYKSGTVANILQRLLLHTSLTYEERYNTILIYEKQTAPTHSSGIQQVVEKVTLTGTVSDKNGPLVGATVVVKGTANGTATDVNGHFTLTVNTADNLVLVVSMIGYKTTEVPVGDQRSFRVLLAEDALNLDQLVVVGYGTQRKATLSGAIADVQLDKLSSRSLNDMAEALQGKAPGVIVQNQGGDPTSVPKVYIRGLGGVNGEEPLYVVDGSIYTGGPINPNDIASINVLKDAAAAIYGARASGGVVIITTKKGREGAATVTLDAKFGYQMAAKKLETLTAKEFADVMNTAADAAGNSRLEAFDASQYPDGQITRTNWLDEIFRSGKIQDYNINVNGGNAKAHYYMGFGYRKGEGILLNTYSERYSFRMNSDAQIKSWLKIGENLSYTYTNGNGANTTSPYTGAIFTALGYPRHITPYNPDGSFSGMPEQYAGAYGDLANPVAILQRLDSKTPVSNININPYAEIQLTKDLLFRSNFAVTKSFSNAKDFTTKVPEIGKISNTNQLAQTINNFSEILSEQTLTYNKQLGDHSLNVLAGYTFQQHEGDGLYVYAGGFNDERDEYRYFDNATLFYKPSSSKNKWAIESYLGRVNYDYKNKYLLTALARRDGTSRVAPQNRYETYYSVSGGWVLTEEAFLRPVQWLSFLKLRGSYGLLGNLGSLPSNAVNIPMEAIQIYMGQTPTQVGGYAENALSNPNLKWANSRQVNIGTDIGLFNNSLSLVADYFIKTTERMLLPVPPPSTAGVSNSTWKNAGKARDNGIELGLNYSGNSGKDFQYSVGATLTKVSNKLLALDEGRTVLPNDISVRSILRPIRTEVGQPLYSYYLVRTNGIFQTQEEIDNYRSKDGALIQPDAQPGDIRFVDKNGDGIISNDDREFVGSAYPDFTYGITFNASYKGFDLNLFAQGVQGNKLFNALKFTNMNASVGTNFNMLKDVLNAWTPENPNSDIPRITADDANGNYATSSDWYIENGSYLRIKNLTLGYTLPAELTKRAGLSALRVYVTANNLYTFTGYKGFDPEVGMDEYGIDKGRYPQARSILLGLNVNF